MSTLHPIPASPAWGRALPPGPDVRVKITEEYARLVARDAYFWTWPLVNIYNRRLVMAQAKEAVRAGPLVFAPLNRNAMFTDYVDPAERAVACPNQDVVYGLASIALDLSPVIVQVPKGVTAVFRSPTNTGFCAPRVFQDDTPEDKKAIQSVLPQVLFYPVSDFDGTMKSKDWNGLPKAPPQASGAEESKWVFPEKFVEQLPLVLADAPPLPGEEAR